MRFQVPQFINVEDRIGPLTVKQYIYTVGGAGAAYAAYKLLPFALAIFIIAPVALLAILLAFVPINGKPFIFTLFAALRYALQSRLYLWKKRPRQPTVGDRQPMAKGAGVPALNESKLKDLTWALDIHQNIKR